MQKKNKVFTLALFICIQIFGMSNFVLAEESEVSALRTGQPFKFEQYPIGVVERGVNKKPILSTKLAKQYKTVITAAMAQPVNFAGQYRVVTWGCGTDCRGFAIINKMSGATYTMPGVEYIAGVMGNDEDRLEFKADSRLFIITGSKNDQIEGKFYYLWDGKKLKLLAKLPIVKQDYSE